MFDDIVQTSRVAVLALALCVPAANAERQFEVFNSRKVAAGEVIVKFRTSSPAAIQFVELLVDADKSSKLGRVGDLRVLHSRSKNIIALLTLLAGNGLLEYVEPNYLYDIGNTPADPGFGKLWGLKNTAQFGGVVNADIQATSAWDLATGSASVGVGVTDTGIDYNHPDLAANVWSAPSAFTVTVAGQSITCAAGSHGFNAITMTCNPLDDHGHGTHVSGTIGAKGNNGVGSTGVNWNTRLIGLKMMDAGGSGTTAEAVNAIDFIIQANAFFAGTPTPLNARVLSASWGGGGFSQALFDAIARANAGNMLFVAAAGNAGVNTDVTPNYPSNYNLPNVISVAATTVSDSRASFSNYGASTVDLGAPGVSIYSTSRGGWYSYMSGTSMATPHVSGVAALALSYCSLNTAGLRSLLLSNIDPLPSLSGITVTGGRLNAWKALRGCTPVVPIFSLSVNPASQLVAAGASTSFSVSATPQNGFAGNVGLSLAGAPAGVTATWATNPMAVGGGTASSSVLNIAVDNSVPTGSYNVVVIGASGALIRTTNMALTVTAYVPPLGLTTQSFKYGVAGYVGTMDATISNTGGGNGRLYLNGRNHVDRSAVGVEYRMMVRFKDISVPAGNRVTSATLKIAAMSYYSGFTIDGFYLSSMWDQSYPTLGWLQRAAGLQWLSPGGGADDRIAGKMFQFTGITATGLQNLTVNLDPGIVQQWIANPASNHGVQLTNSNVGTSTFTYSWRNVDPNTQPVLTITSAP